MLSVFRSGVTGNSRLQGAARLAAAVSAAVLSSSLVSAANNVFIWTGGTTQDAPATGVWSASTSWVNGTTPPSDPNTELQFNGSTSYTSSNDISNPFTLNALTFNNSSLAGVTVDGTAANNSLYFTYNASNSPIVLPLITQNGSGPVTISAPITVGATLSTATTTASTLSVLGTGTGAVNFTGPINLAAVTSTSANSANGATLIFAKPGVINVTGTITLPGSNVPTANSLAGAIEVTTGTVNFAGNSSVLVAPVTTTLGTVPTNTGPNFEIGGPTGTAVVNVTTSGVLTFVTPDVGGVFTPANTTNATTKAAVGVVNQSSGTFGFSTTGGTVQSNYLSIGSGNTTPGGTGGYGAYLLSGGVLTANGIASGGGIRVGAAGPGVFVMTGGSITPARYLSIGTYSTGVATFVGGTVTGTAGASASATVVGESNGGSGTFNLGTLAGGTATYNNLSTQTINGSTGFVIGGSSSSAVNDTGVVNLDAGTLVLAGGIGRGYNASTNAAVLNLNGATIQAAGIGTTLINSIASAPLVANVYGRGITIDSQTNTTTISANLSGATATGIFPAGGMIPVTAGAGYLAPPLVTITDTSRSITSTATAVANVSNGAITGVTLTNPGIGYQAGDVLTFTFIGGQQGSTAAYYTLTSTYTLASTDLVSNAGGGLTKLGTGTLALTGTNTYTGVTNISSGVLQPGGAYALPGLAVPGAVQVSSGATLALSVGGAGQFTTNDLTSLGNVIFANGSFLGVNTNSATAPVTASANLTGGEGFNKLGANTLILSGNNTYTGATTVSAGTLQINSPGAIGATSGVTVANGASFSVADNTGFAGLTGGAAGGSPITVNIQGTGVGGNGAFRSADSATSTFAGTINIAPTAINVSGGTIAAGANGTLILTAPITGNGNVVFSGNSGDTSPGSAVVLNAVSTFSGETQINGPANASGSTTVRLGIDNALPTGNGVRFLATNAGNGYFDLNGHNQTIQYLAGNAPAGSQFSGIVNSAVGTTSTLTITNGTGINGVSIADHNGPTGGVVAVNLTGGTQTFSGSSNYSGGTNVGSGATLTAGSATAFGTGAVTLSGGTLSLAGTVRNTVFSGFNGFTLNKYNSASTTPTLDPTNSILTITTAAQTGSSAYSPPTPVALNTGFVASFTYTSNSPAGGVAFVLQNDPRGANAVGSPGGAFGYSFDTTNYTVTSSLFATLNSAALDINASSSVGVRGTALAQNGQYVTAFNSSSPFTNLSTGSPINVTVAYNAPAQTLTVNFSNGSSNSFSFTYPNVNYSSVLGTNTPYIGFTGGTGGGGNNQVISNFTFANLATGPVNIANAITTAPGTASTLQTATSPGFTQQSVGAISLGTNSTLTVSVPTGSPRAVLVTPSVSGTGRFDLIANDLDVTANSTAAVSTLVASGVITSSLAAADTTHLTTLGVIQNNQGGSPIFSATNKFDGATPGPSDVLVKYTYFGDANLDGKVDGSDYSLIDHGFATPGSTGWYNGDFNYDGQIDGSDYTLIDNAYNRQGVQLTSAALVATPTAVPAAVPEPAGLAAGACVVAVGLRRRKCGTTSARIAAGVATA